jgi:serine/threonine protein kinase
MNLKISDFGASVKNKSKYKTTVRDTMTHEYASIEQLNEDEAVPGFDVWSLGIIVYQLMTGSLPYEANRANMITTIKETQRPSLPETYS